MSNVEHIRREYNLGSLLQHELNSSPIDQFNLWLSQAIESKLFMDATAATLATVNAEGMPTNRIVLLKAVDQGNFRFFTNYESDKAQDIAVNDRVCLSFSWPALERQVIIRGHATKCSDEVNDGYFAQRPRTSQLGAHASKQSQVVASREALADAYAKAEAKFDEQEVPRPRNWGGYDIAPVAIEFWQGGAARLHDRFIYILKDGAWEINRHCP